MCADSKPAASQSASVHLVNQPVQTLLALPQVLLLNAESRLYPGEHKLQQFEKTLVLSLRLGLTVSPSAFRPARNLRQ